jgi:hypothetical protein
MVISGVGGMIHLFVDMDRVVGVETGLAISRPPPQRRADGSGRATP